MLPAVTTPAAASKRLVGRRPSSSGPMTLIRTGARHRNGDHGRLRMFDPADDGHVEQHQAGGGNPAEPEPLPAAGSDNPYPGAAGDQQQDQHCGPVPQCLGREQRAVDQCPGHADAGTDDHHPSRAGGDRAPHSADGGVAHVGSFGRG